MDAHAREAQGQPREGADTPPPEPEPPRRLELPAPHPRGDRDAGLAASLLPATGDRVKGCRASPVPRLGEARLASGHSRYACLYRGGRSSRSTLHRHVRCGKREDSEAAKGYLPQRLQHRIEHASDDSRFTLVRSWAAPTPHLRLMASVEETRYHRNRGRSLADSGGNGIPS